MIKNHFKDATFAEKVTFFYKNIKLPSDFPSEIIAMNPYLNKKSLELTEKFLNKYFNNRKNRIFVFGINPGRFGGGATGVNFTDAFALENYCGIRNNLPKTRELSSSFIYEFINAYGGPSLFYKKFFLTALSPLGFIKNGLNYNFYDDKPFLNFIEPFITDNLIKQIGIGANRKVAILFGAGKNKIFFDKLNKENKYFEKYFVLEHPRYIMQYKRKLINDYIKKYTETFLQALQISVNKE